MYALLFLCVFIIIFLLFDGLVLSNCRLIFHWS